MELGYFNFSQLRHASLVYILTRTCIRKYFTLLHVHNFLKKQQQKLKKAYINPAISSMGYNRTWPLAMW